MLYPTYSRVGRGRRNLVLGHSILLFKQFFLKHSMLSVRTHLLVLDLVPEQRNENINNN